MGVGNSARSRGATAVWAAVVAVGATTAGGADWFVDGPGLPGEACESYALVEALAMQRGGGSGGPFVFNSVTALPVISADSLQFAMAPGIRALYGRHGPAALGWEVGYVGVYGMVASRAAEGPDNLDIAPLLSGAVTGLRNASAAFAKSTSAFDSVEANLLLTQQNWKPARASAYAADDATRIVTWDWIAGFRWAGISEGAEITLTQSGLADTYDLRTRSDLFGGQLGFRGRADWGLWSLDGWLKAALAGAALSQTQGPIIDAVTTDVFRPGWSAQTGGVGGIFDIDIAVSRRIAEHWALRVGWNSIWVAGAALATNQFDFSDSQAPGTGVATGGTFWINGVTLGVEGRW